jgi:hypothetical protein
VDVIAAAYSGTEVHSAPPLLQRLQASAADLMLAVLSRGTDEHADERVVVAVLDAQVQLGLGERDGLGRASDKL